MVFRSALALVVIVSIVGCAATPPLPRSGELPPVAELLDGSVLLGESISEQALPAIETRALTPEMRDFVSRSVAGVSSAEGRLQRLLWEMRRNGLLTLNYQSTITGTATETFETRVGNCLSFTNLFVALARDAGLEVSYQQVDIPPVWSSGGELLMLNQHVNVRVHRTTRERASTHDHVVDFNAPEYTGNYPQRPVGDAVVDALFHNNLAVDALIDDDPRTAFLHFRAALMIDPRSTPAWTNLGVLFQRNGLDTHAEAAFHQALAHDAGHKVAMSNLARLYDRLGQGDLAAVYRDRIRRHQLQNPYYHFFLAEQAVAQADLDAALRAVERAIRLREEEHQFHFLRAQTLEALGQREAARLSLLRAQEHATFAAIRNEYGRKLEMLD